MFHDQPGQLLAANSLSGAIQMLHLLADMVKSPGEESHACDVIERQCEYAMEKRIERVKGVQHMNGLQQDVLGAEDVYSFESR